MCGIFAYISKDKIQYSKRTNIVNNFIKTSHRGPDETRVTSYCDKRVLFGFHRLAIMDVTSAGMQPFEYKDLVCICNGEIYNFEELEKNLNDKVDYKFHTHSDCEVILPLFDYLGRDIKKLCKTLYGEYSLIILDKTTGIVYAGSDELRVRPNFIGFSQQTTSSDYEIMFSSEIKSICDLAQEIIPFPSGCVWTSEEPKKFERYYFFPDPNTIHDDYDVAKGVIRDLFIKSVTRKFEISDVPVGFLLSGGLDSSLCCAVGARIAREHYGPDYKIRTFSIGFDKESKDIINARKVADFLGTDHTELIFNVYDGIDALRDVIYYLETFDQTTIRAATGMVLGSKWIRDNTDIKVLISGEVADELLQGYIYFKYQPNSLEGHAESVKRLKDIYMFDGLRADRSVSAYSIELRVPFFDRDLMNYVLALNPDYLNPNCNGGIEKKIMRDAFRDDEWLPSEIIDRHKEAFTDGVSSGKNEWVTALKANANILITDDVLENSAKYFKHITPRNKEELFYRNVFTEFFPRKEKVIGYQWLPRVDWLPESIRSDNIDSSATALVDIYK